MIGEIFPVGRGFKGLLSYLATGTDGRQHGRAAWMEFHNLPTRDAQLAACFMAATARDSVSGTRTPLYHFSVSFDVNDPVDEAMMRRVAERTRRDMGLQEYEAVVVAHQDRSHLHLHFVVNRVHPEGLTLWSNWWDYARLEKSLRAQEMELGLRIVPGWHAPVPAASLARDGLADPQPEALIRPQPGPKRGGPEFLREVTERAAPVLEQAGSWAELERGLAERGLSLRVKGGGFRITDGSRQVKASDVGRSFSRYHLEKRLGRHPDYRARMAVAESALVPAPASSSSRTEAPARPQEAPAAAAADALQPSVESPPAETHGPVQPDAPPEEPVKPSQSRRLIDFLMEVKERGGPVLERAESWEALERGLADRGLCLRVKGGGFVVTDGELEVKASEAGRAFSRFHLENRLGRYPHYRTPAASSEPTSTPASARQQEQPAPTPVQSPPPVVEPAAPVRQPAQPVAPPVPVVPPAETPKPAQPRRRLVDFLLEVKERGAPVLERAESWEALERELADRGLSLRVKGGGFVVTNGQMEVKASQVGRAFSRNHLERRLGPYPHYRAPSTSTEPTPKSIVPEPVRRQERPAPAPAQAPPPVVEPAAPVQPPMQPVAAPVPVKDSVPASDPAFVSQGHDRPWIDVALDEAARSLRILEKWDAADAVLRDARDALSVAGTASRALDGWKTPAEVVMAHLRQSARSVYLDPDSAVRELLDHARDERRLEEAKEWLRTSPEYFGKLKPDAATGWATLIRPWNTFKTARRKARGLADRLDAAARHEWKRPKPEAYTRAVEEVEKAKAAVDAASAARDAVSKLSRKSLMERVTLALEPLRAAMGHEEIERRLGHKLTPEAVYLLPRALKRFRNLAEGPQLGGNELEF